MTNLLDLSFLSPRITCNYPNMDSLITMVRADMGITFLSSGVAQSYLENDLVCIPLHPIFRTQTAMITRKRTGSSVDALQYFEDYFYGIIHWPISTHMDANVKYHCNMDTIVARDTIVLLPAYGEPYPGTAQISPSRQNQIIGGSLR